MQCVITPMRYVHVLVMALAVSAVGRALADEGTEAGTLLRASPPREALARANAFLKSHPHDVRMRFAKAVILTGQNRLEEAIALYTGLTGELPTLAEAQNNLAVLLASSGQYDNARAKLEIAVRINPSYGTAHENLGDIYAKMAIRYYGGAVTTDARNKSSQLKMTAIHAQIANTMGVLTPDIGTLPIMRSPAADTPAADTPAGAATESESAVTVPPTPILNPDYPNAHEHLADIYAKMAIRSYDTVLSLEPGNARVQAKLWAMDEIQNANIPASSIQDIAAGIGSPQQPGADTQAERTRIVQMIERWRRAWSAKDVKGYLGCYGSDFKVPGGDSRATWESKRRARISGKAHIHVDIEAIGIVIADDRATAVFRQVYVSDRLKETSGKVLALARHGADWQIVEESAGR